MINAAKSDGRIDLQEQQRILSRLGNLAPADYEFLDAEFQRPLNLEEFAAEVPVGMEEQIYALSLTGIDLDTHAEGEYLRRLARALRISRTKCEEIHRRLGVRPLSGS
jgi:uncharacterized membrane protein YebE (DUF533 family)